jgi:WD40 repeat protein
MKVEKIDFKVFYEFHFRENKTSGLPESEIAVAGDTFRVAISDGGELIAIASRGTDGMPKVEIRPAAEKDTRFTLDFGKYVANLSDRWRLPKIAFDLGSTAVVVELASGLDNPSFLLAFRLKDRNPVPWRIGTADPGLVRDWNLTLDGKYIAIVAGVSISIADIQALLENVTIQSRDFRSSYSSSALRTVAFSPKGSLLATGDEAGVVTIYHRSNSDSAEEVLRLDHEHTPIIKLGFSPDGRVLAVLFKDNASAKDAPHGTIRLWLTENWEKDRDGPSGAATRRTSTPEGGNRGASEGGASHK